MVVTVVIRFTPVARLALAEAEQQARKLRHRSLTPDELLLALLDQDEGPATEILRSVLGPHAGLIRMQIYQLRGINLSEILLPTKRDLPRTAEFNRVLDLARMETLLLSDRWIDTNHLLVGILAEGTSIAAKVLNQYGLDLAKARRPGITRSLNNLLASRRDHDGGRDEAVFAAVREDAARRLLPIRAESTAILMGTAHYADEKIHDLTAVTANLTDLRDALTDPVHGVFDADRVVCFPDPVISDLPRIVELAAEPLDTLLIYYAGHGFLEDDLYLGLHGTESAHIDFTALAYDMVRKIVLRGSSRRNLIVLDCCHAGAAIEFMAEDIPGGVIDIRGAFVLTATARNELAHAPAEERNTSFTGALLRVLREGVEGGGPLITVRDLTTAMTRLLRANGRPLPRQRASDTIAELAIRRNVAWRGAEPGQHR